MSAKIFQSDGKGLVQDSYRKMREKFMKAGEKVVSRNYGRYHGVNMDDLLESMPEWQKVDKEFKALLCNNIWKQADIVPIQITGTPESLKNIFQRKIDGKVFFYRGACFLVRGLYSDDDAILLVQEVGRKQQNVSDFLRNCDAPENLKIPGERRPIPETVRHEVWRRDQGKCVRCSSVLNLEFDHVIPFSRGGSSTARNIQLLCEICNRQKSAKV